MAVLANLKGNDMEPISKADLELARKILMVRIANAICSARIHLIRQGWTDEALATRIGWTHDRWEKALLSPENLEEISAVLLACDCDLSWRFRPSPQQSNIPESA